MSVDDLAKRISEIEDKLQEPKKKDRWDKAAILSSIVTPLMIGFATVIISSSQTKAADKTAAAQLEVAQTNSLVEQGKLVPNMMDALLDYENPTRQALAVMTVREALPDIGEKVLEAAISVDPSIEFAAFASTLTAEVSFGFVSEMTDVPEDALFDSTPSLTLRLYEKCDLLVWGDLNGTDCEEVQSISSDSVLMKRNVSETVDTLSVQQVVQFIDFRGDTARFFRNLKNPNYQLFADFHVSTPSDSKTTAFLNKLANTEDVNRFVDHESAAHCLYRITPQQKTDVEDGEYGDYIYSFYPMPAALSVISVGETIESLHGYLASLWVYDEQVDEIYNIEFRPVDDYPVTQTCLQSFGKSFDQEP